VASYASVKIKPTIANRFQESIRITQQHEVELRLLIETESYEAIKLRRRPLQGFHGG